mgnify:CR=1 FL=1
MYVKDTIAVTETVGEWRARGGVVKMNESKRPTTLSLSKGSSPAIRACKRAYQLRFGYIQKLGSKNALKNITPQQVLKAFKHASDKTIITEIYPTRFCINERCRAPSWNFIKFEHKGHSTCKKCGTCNRIEQEHLGSLHLNDDGHANKSKWTITPGMSIHDIEVRKNGKTIVSQGQRVKSHRRNFWRIQKKIDDIAHDWHFGAIENMIKSAKAKLSKYYYRVHSDTDSDDMRKMPHGAAALAAACFYAAVLEYEQRLGVKTVCTLPAIQESAQAARDHKSQRITRDVTDTKILKYTRMLRQCGLCNAKVPHIGAETLRFHPKSSALEHSRMSIFNECAPTRFHLPMNKPWGITIEDSKKGVLQIKSIKTDGNAFAAGIRKGDYIFQVNRELADYKLNPVSFQRWVQDMKRKSPKKPMLELTIMRKKKINV